MQQHLTQPWSINYVEASHLGRVVPKLGIMGHLFQGSEATLWNEERFLTSLSHLSGKNLDRVRESNAQCNKVHRLQNAGMHLF